MKRSDVNRAIVWAKKLIEGQNITLPQFAYWTMNDWKNNKEKISTIKTVMLGWDVTDFGLDNYTEVGAVLFTVRNGKQGDTSVGVQYAEKYILLKEGQVLPTHFHYSKTEDIINRAGGVLALKLYNAKDDYNIDYDSDVIVYMDGVRNIVKPGEVVLVNVGCSITLTPFMYHNFWAFAGKGDLVVGEISTVNDDNIDNHFNPKVPRFGEINEDEMADVPLCNEYENL
jgi:D-lyxose ketol-isomerase